MLLHLERLKPEAVCAMDRLSAHASPCEAWAGEQPMAQK